MIKQKEVVTMYIPFPNISADLAQKVHMYICLGEGDEKEFIKCQSFKPTHLFDDVPPDKYVLEECDCKRNPFVKKTTIDCDKSFLCKEVVFDRGILKNRGVCEDLFNSILAEIKHENFFTQLLDEEALVNLNSLIKYR